MAQNGDDLANQMQRSLNVNAAVFVPSWASPPAPATSQETPHRNGVDEDPRPSQVQPPPPPDEWDKMEDEPSPASAPSPAPGSGPSSVPPANTTEINNSGPGGDVMEGEKNGEEAGPAPAPGSNSMEVEMSPETTGAGTAPAVKKKTKPEESVKKVQAKEHLNVVFVGHVDAGKSTLGGQIMFLTGEVDKRTLEKYEREAREQNRESWYISWALDTNKEEREKGKTVEVGRASFETEKKTFTILDAPGHRSYVPNMIGGAAQADVAILVISARKGEFETGFEKGGQTREHTTLIKTAGVKHLVVVINKMDDSTVEWSEHRYNEIVEKLTPFLKKASFNVKKDVYFMPISGFTGAFVKDVPSPNPFPSYGGPSLLTYLDELPKILRTDGPLRLPVAGKYKDMGVVVCGKIESGFISISKGKGDLMVMPARKEVSVLSIFTDKEETDIAYTGENVELKLKGIEEEDISNGFVLCDRTDLCHVCRKFEAQLMIVDYDSIICPGFSCMMHCHTANEEVVFKSFVATVDKKTGKRSDSKPRFVRQDEMVIAILQASRPVCLEMFSQFPQMGRFTLRCNDKTIAMGKIEKLASSKNTSANSEQSG